MLNVENLQIGDNSYVIRDANTYRSLTSTQETQLRATGTYNGEAVENGEVFTKEDGTFQEFVKTHHLPDGYIDTNTTIASVYQSSALATTYNNIEMVVRGPSSDGYVEYSENGGFTWRRSSLVVDGVPQDFYVDVNISFSICKGATSADVFIVRSGAYQYASTCYLSTDGGKTFEEKGGLKAFEFDIATGIGVSRHIGKSMLDFDLRLVIGMTRISDSKDSPKTWQGQLNITYWFL